MIRPLAVLLVAFAAPLPAQLGRIEFPTSAHAPETQQAFVEGVLLLHSFEYEDARAAFRRAQEREPEFAMAYWGEALTFQHPVWRREEPDQARQALAKLAPTPAARRAKAPTDLEQSWLHSVEVLFGDGTRNARWTGYRDALAALRARYPHDVEIGALYGLSILGTSFGQRDTRIYMRAAGVLQSYYHRHPDHPALLHYLIHCYDDPVHAPLGLAMARRYDQIAPDAGHALHMPSHIYLALGMWQDSIRANEASFAAGDKRRARKQLGVDARNWHACEWLAYSYLQRGRIRDAAKLLEVVWHDHEASQTRRMRFYVISMRAALLVHTGAWRGPYTTYETGYADLLRSTVAADHLVHGLSALESNDRATAEKHLAALRALAPANLVLDKLRGPAAICCAPSGQTTETVEDQLAAMVIVRQLEGALALAAGQREAAVTKLREACDLEERMSLDFGPPIVVKPAHEMLGEVLLQLGDSKVAATEFEAALVRAPGRARSLLGLARARKAAGDAVGAQATYRELAALWRDADEDLPDLEEVRRNVTAR